MKSNSNIISYSVQSKRATAITKDWKTGDRSIKKDTCLKEKKKGTDW